MGLLRIWTLSFTVIFVLSNRRFRSIRCELPALCETEAVLLCGALLAESEGCTSPPESAYSSSTRGGGTRGLVPVVAAVRRALCAGPLTASELDIIETYTLRPHQDVWQHDCHRHQGHCSMKDRIAGDAPRMFEADAKTSLAWSSVA